MDGSRTYDIVLFGATGFAGELTARQLAERMPRNARWALAGRNPAKLERVRDRIAAGYPEQADLPLLQADSSQLESLRAVAASGRVVISTVGPYLRYGEPLVRACAEAGTDYVDLTGEPEFVDRMYLNHHETALTRGARLVHACGFDSIPHDLGAMFTVAQLPRGVPVRIRGVVRSNASFSGGTFHSALESLARTGQMRETMIARRKAEPRPEGRRSQAITGKPGRDKLLGYWLLPLPTIDPFVVARSGAALTSYGPDFGYSHYAGTKTLRYAAGGTLGVAALALGTRLKPVRETLKKRIPAGTGPDAARRARSWFTVDFVGEGGGHTVHTQVRGGDPGYTETAKMLAESAMCLAFDDNPPVAGQLTPAAAMGENLLARLRHVGLVFEILS